MLKQFILDRRNITALSANTKLDTHLHLKLTLKMYMTNWKLSVPFALGKGENSDYQYTRNQGTWTFLEKKNNMVRDFPQCATCPSFQRQPCHHQDSRHSGADSSQSCACDRWKPFRKTVISLRHRYCPETLRHLSPVQNGRMSKMRTVPSIELVKTFEPSGLSIMPVTVSVWPLISVTTAFFLRSQTLTMLSMPALITWLASSLKHTEVTWNGI